MGLDREFDDRGSVPLDSLVASFVRAHPSPPRPAPTQRLIRASYEATSSKTIAVVGAILGLPMAGVALVSLSEARLGWSLMLVVGLVVGVGFPLVPVVAALRSERALRRGVVIEAAVVELTTNVDHGDQTLDALRHGFTAGLARIEDAERSFVAPFEIDVPWGRDVREGSTLVGLAHPSEEKVWMWLGRRT